jgi:hypothetical protein
VIELNRFADLVHRTLSDSRFLFVQSAAVAIDRRRFSEVVTGCVDRAEYADLRFGRLQSMLEERATR